MPIRICLAFCLSFAIAAPAHAAPVQRAKSEVTSNSVLALKAMRRMKHELTNGKSIDELKFPEGKETLDFMLDGLKKARAQHAPPKKNYKSPYRPGDEQAPADLAERIDNPNHPTYLKELAFMDAMLERGMQLKRDGVPYKEFVDYSLHGWSRAISLALDPRENHGTGAMMRRETSLDPNGPTDGWWPSWTPEAMHGGDHFWFPTAKPLSIADFNRLSPYRVSFIGLTDKAAWGDEGWWSPSQFPLHDVIHGFAGMSPDRAVSNRYQKAIAKVKDPEVRHLLELNWFGITHEDSDFDYRKLDAATEKYSADKFAEADKWLADYRQKDYGPHLAHIAKTYRSELAKAEKESPQAARVIEAVWRNAGGDSLSPKRVYTFKRKVPANGSFYAVESSLGYDHYLEVSNCRYSKGCEGVVLAALKSVSDAAHFEGVVPVEKPSSVEDR